MGTISLRNVRKAFGDATIIPNANLDIGNGEFIVFVGPSGCGKSTLLRLIAGLEDLTSGVIEIDGRDVTAAAPSERGLAMVFQSYALYPHMSVRNNIAFAPTYGSIQGAGMALETKRANAFDTASLEIALFRAAGTPARYVYGAIEVPIDQAANWIGGAPTPAHAFELINKAGIPSQSVIAGGAITAIRLLSWYAL